MSDEKEPREGDMRVWWIPQVPMKKTFQVEVEDAKEARKMIDTLAEYDWFQYDNDIKPDYSNAGGLEVFEDGEWLEWESADGESINDISI